MDLKQLDLAVKEAAGKEPAPPKKYLDKIRKNLFNLLCQSDEKELIGGVADFGGKEEVGEAIAKAVMNLFALGASFDVDVAASIEKVMPGKKETTAGIDIPKVQDKAQEPMLKVDVSKPVQPPKVDQASGSKATKIQMYKNAIDEAKSEGDIRKIFNKDIGPDKALDGKDKAALGEHMKNALKKFNSK